MCTKHSNTKYRHVRDLWQMRGEDESRLHFHVTWLRSKKSILFIMYLSPTVLNEKSSEHRLFYLSFSLNGRNSIELGLKEKLHQNWLKSKFIIIWGCTTTRDQVAEYGLPVMIPTFFCRCVRGGGKCKKQWYSGNSYTLPHWPLWIFLTL